MYNSSATKGKLTKVAEPPLDMTPSPTQDAPPPSDLQKHNWAWPGSQMDQLKGLKEDGRTGLPLDETTKTQEIKGLAQLAELQTAVLAADLY